jgi:hypothetical protein
VYSPRVVALTWIGLVLSIQDSLPDPPFHCIHWLFYAQWIVKQVGWNHPKSYSSSQCVWASVWASVAVGLVTRLGRLMLEYTTQGDLL